MTVLMGVWWHRVGRLWEGVGELARIRADRGKLLRCPWLLDEPITVRRQFEEPLVEDRPGSIPMRQDIACPVHLEARARHLTRQIRAHRQSREQLTQGLDEQEHCVYRPVAQVG